MDINSVINDFFSNPKIGFYLSLLKTEKWAKLTEKEKKKFFMKFNSAFCEFLDINELRLEIVDSGIKSEDVGDCYYSNVMVKGKGHLVINDINYNQYLTLYEYIFRVREEVQNLVCFTKLGDKFDSKLKANWNKNLDVIEFGDIKIDFYIEDGEFLSEYQSVKLDAKKYAENIVVEVVKRNFDINNSTDEQAFMINKDILINKMIKDIGVELLDIKNFKEEIFRDEVLEIKNKVDKLCEADLSDLASSDLVLALYPSISKTLDIRTLTRVYNELFSRIYDDFDIKYSKGKVFINGNEWGMKYFYNNHLNVVLYEYIKLIDEVLRNDSSFLNSDDVKEKGVEEAIINVKKNCLYNIILKLDLMANSKELQAIGEQPLFRMVNKECLNSNLRDTKNGFIPLKKRGK